MYAAIRRYTYERGNLNEMSALVERSFLPAVSQIAGFVAYYVIDSGMGTLTTVTVFETRDGADKSVRLAAEWTAKNLADVGLSRPQITAGEVRVHKMAEHGVGA